MSGMHSTVAGHVAQRVDALVGGGDLARSGRSCSVPTSPHDAARSRRRRGRCEKPGMASSLSSVPPVWPRPRPATIGTGHAARGDERREAMETLSPTPPVECLSTLTPGTLDEVEHVARVEHRVGERHGLGVVEAAEEDGHEPGGHLVVGELARRERRRGGRSRRASSALAVALGGDELDERSRARHGAEAIAPRRRRLLSCARCQALVLARWRRCAARSSAAGCPWRRRGRPGRVLDGRARPHDAPRPRPRLAARAASRRPRPRPRPRRVAPPRPRPRPSTAPAGRAAPATAPAARRRAATSRSRPARSTRG